MTNLHKAAQQALEFIEFCWRDVSLNEYAEEKRSVTEAALRAALAEVSEPLSPVCEAALKPAAAEVSGSTREQELQKLLEEAKEGLSFYERRCNALQACQSQMRDPERTMVCDILANGSLLFNGNGKFAEDRYAHPPAHPQRQPLSDAEIDSSVAAARDALLDHIYEHGTTAEGVMQRVRNIARAIEKAHGISGEQK